MPKYSFPILRIILECLHISNLDEFLKFIKVCKKFRNILDSYYRYNKRFLFISLPKLKNQLIKNIQLENIRYYQKYPSNVSFINLQILYCSNNKLEHLPPEIGQLASLQTFNCYNNKLEQLPPEIGQLTNLQTLYCANNKLEQLPPEIGLLTNLREVDCFNNKIEEIPVELRHFNIRI